MNVDPSSSLKIHHVQSMLVFGKKSFVQIYVGRGPLFGGDSYALNLRIIMTVADKRWTTFIGIAEAFSCHSVAWGVPQMHVQIQNKRVYFTWSKT